MVRWSPFAYDAIPIHPILRFPCDSLGDLFTHSPSPSCFCDWHCSSTVRWEAPSRQNRRVTQGIEQRLTIRTLVRGDQAECRTVSRSRSDFWSSICIHVQVTSQHPSIKKNHKVTGADVRSTWRTTNGFFLRETWGKTVMTSDWRPPASFVGSSGRRRGKG